MNSESVKYFSLQYRRTHFYCLKDLLQVSLTTVSLSSNQSVSRA